MRGQASVLGGPLNLSSNRMKRGMFDDLTIARFWSKVAVGEAGKCWEWQGTRSRYGKFYAAGKMIASHRYLAMMLAERVLAAEEKACHSCDNPPCCNPAHLWIGTNQQNLLDARAKGRLFSQTKTHCPRGHAYDEKNTRYVTSSTGISRACRICTNGHQRAKARASK